MCMKVTLCFVSIKHGKDMGNLLGVDDRDPRRCYLVVKLMTNHTTIVSLPKVFFSFFLFM